MNIKYTPQAIQALEGAEAAARQFNHAYLGTEHILLSILAIPSCEACTRFERLGLDPDSLADWIRGKVRGETGGTRLS